ncbi:lasso peptide biosynthesis PqqD family chaperone [Paenibacillus gorillae]|uniref:lasso peptide biosynthesis PqqD family chaperone n=1 Tax=Paenibacillus gorillae TaxID=1243662 RepID=UPI0004AD9F23|nr:lasso peptide biosynthesis PqqD family chaperone [Paenibacillus gorillae]
MTTPSGVFAGQTVMRAEGFLVSDMGGDKVMMNVATGKYYNLGQTGGRIWELLSEPSSLEGLVDSLCSEYEIDREVCERQVTSFLSQLTEQGLIQTRSDEA